MALVPQGSLQGHGPRSLTRKEAVLKPTARWKKSRAGRGETVAGGPVAAENFQKGQTKPSGCL